MKCGGRKRKYDGIEAFSACEPEPSHEQSAPFLSESETDACAADEGLHANSWIVDHQPLIEHLAGTLSEDTHPNLGPGLWLASLSARLNVEGLPLVSLFKIVDVFESHVPGVCGNTNHSKKFARQYISAMAREVKRR